MAKKKQKWIDFKVHPSSLVYVDRFGEAYEWEDGRCYIAEDLDPIELVKLDALLAAAKATSSATAGIYE